VVAAQTIDERVGPLPVRWNPPSAMSEAGSGAAEVGMAIVIAMMSVATQATEGGQARKNGRTQNI
jgi:hypothetical protein